MRSNYLPQGCDYQGRHPEAAHAASEWDDEPRPPLSPGEAVLLCAIALLSTLAMIGVAAVVWNRFA